MKINLNRDWYEKRINMEIHEVTAGAALGCFQRDTVHRLITEAVRALVVPQYMASWIAPSQTVFYVYPAGAVSLGYDKGGELSNVRWRVQITEEFFNAGTEPPHASENDRKQEANKSKVLQEEVDRLRHAIELAESQCLDRGELSSPTQVICAMRKILLEALRE